MRLDNGKDYENRDGMAVSVASAVNSDGKLGRRLAEGGKLGQLDDRRKRHSANVG